LFSETIHKGYPFRSDVNRGDWWQDTLWWGFRAAWPALSHDPLHLLKLSITFAQQLQFV
jgi:hypothetical protein